MAELARKLALVEVTSKDIGGVVGLTDCLGEEVIHLDTARAAAKAISEGAVVNWGDLLYTPLTEFIRRDLESDLVPFGLAKILLLVSSADLLKFGYFDKPSEPNPTLMPLFRDKGIKVFLPQIEAIPVTAGLSIESAGKSRLVTSNPAAYTQIGQTLNHFMRNWLSKDPFCRVGFEEADKLWEVLKSYGKAYQRGRFGRPTEHH